MVKDFLSQRGVKFEERDVSRNQQYAQELMQTGQRGVPVTKFENEIIVGFDQNRLNALIPRMQAAGKPSFGAAVADASAITAKKGGPVQSGAYIGKIKPGSTAERMKLQVGDIITWINKMSISNAAQLEQAIASLKPGQQLTIIYLRGGTSHSTESVL